MLPLLLFLSYLYKKNRWTYEREKKFKFLILQIFATVLSFIIAFFIFSNIVPFIVIIYSSILSFVFDKILPLAFQMYSFSGRFSAMAIFSSKITTFAYTFIFTVLILEIIAYYKKNGVKKDYGEQLKDTKDKK